MNDERKVKELRFWMTPHEYIPYPIQTIEVILEDNSKFFFTVNQLIEYINDLVKKK